jgi:hypothetical protein
MKRFILASASCLCISVISLAQMPGRDNTSYSQPVQIDSSDNYIIASLIDKTNKTKYNYTGTYRVGGNWTNIFIYNTATTESKKIFSTNPVLIFPLSPIWPNAMYVQQQEIRFSYSIRDYMLLLVKTDSYNQNGIIEEDDPTSLYIVSKTGNNLTQISPKDMNVMSYTLSRDGKTILIKLQKDNNNDKKFLDEDEVLYQINLDRNYSKIKATPVKLQ